MNKKGKALVSDIEDIIKDLEKERPDREYSGWVVEDGELIRIEDSRQFNELMKEMTKDKL